MISLRKPFAGIGSVILLSSLVGCGGPTAKEDEQFHTFYASLNQLFDKLDGVKDAETAKAARPELNRLDQQARSLLPIVTAMPLEHRKALVARYQSLFDGVKEKHAHQVERMIKGDLPSGMLEYTLVTAEEVKK